MESSLHLLANTATTLSVGDWSEHVNSVLALKAALESIAAQEAQHRATIERLEQELRERDEDDEPYCTCPIEHDDNEIGFNRCSSCGKPVEGT